MQGRRAAGVCVWSGVCCVAAAAGQVRRGCWSRECVGVSAHPDTWVLLLGQDAGLVGIEKKSMVLCLQSKSVKDVVALL